MIRALLAVLTLAALGCTPQEAAQNCDLSAERTLAFTASDAEDSIVARSLGAACGKAIAVFALVTAEDEPIYAWAQPMPRAFGDDFHSADAEHVQAFLDRWAAEASVSTTGLAPPYAAREASGARVTLDRETYEDIRARDLPMLCHLSGVARETCVFWEPAAGGAGLLYERDVAIPEPTVEDASL